MDKTMCIEKCSMDTGSNLNIQQCLAELDHPDTVKELKTILQSINEKSPFSNSLFKKKYRVFLTENLLKWMKPFGDVYKQTLVFCYAEQKVRVLSDVTEDVGEDADDAGSPLSLEFDSLLNLNVEPGTIYKKNIVKQLTRYCELFPVPQEIGHKLLLLCKSAEVEAYLQKTPVLVISYNDKNPKLFLIIGNHAEKNQCSTCLVKHLGTVNKEEQLPRLDGLKLHHLKCFPPSDVEVLGTAHYVFLDDLNQESTLYPVCTATTSVECHWSNSLHVLEPISNDSRCFVTIDGIIGSPDTGACSLFSDLSLLEKMNSCLRKNDCCEWFVKSAPSVFDQVESLLSAPRSSLCKKLPSYPSVVSWDLFDYVVLKSRNNYDFSDKLWDVLKACSEFRELRKAFLHTFAVIEDSTYPPFVFSKSKSKFAQHIRQMSDKPNSAPTDIDFIQATTLLLEIGIEKVRRDIVNFFMSLELVPYEYLTYFLQPELLSPEAISRLKKLHNLIEAIIVCVKRLRLSKKSLSEYVRSSLKSFCATPEDEWLTKFTFEIPVFGGEIKALLDSVRPIEWQIRLMSKTEDNVKMTFHRFEIAAESSHISAKKMCQKDPAHLKKVKKDVEIKANRTGVTDPREILKAASYAYVTAVMDQTKIYEADV